MNQLNGMMGSEWTDPYIKFVWKHHTSQSSTRKCLGPPFGLCPLFNKPGAFDILTALSLPLWSDATDEDSNISFELNVYSLLTKAGWRHTCFPCSYATLTIWYPLSSMSANGIYLPFTKSS